MYVTCVGLTSCVLSTAGNFGVDKAVAARAAYEAVMTFDERISRQHLQTVRFVNCDAATTSMFVAIFKSLHDTVTSTTENTNQGITEKVQMTSQGVGSVDSSSVSVGRSSVGKRQRRLKVYLGIFMLFIYCRLLALYVGL